MSPLPEAVTLAGEQVGLCRAVLCNDLMRVSELLAAGKDGSGNKLTKHGWRELAGFSNKLQLTLLVFGLTSSELEGMVMMFSKKPK
jgi:hypothetical protein